MSSDIGWLYQTAAEIGWSSSAWSLWMMSWWQFLCCREIKWTCPLCKSFVSLPRSPQPLYGEEGQSVATFGTWNHKASLITSAPSSFTLLHHTNSLVTFFFLHSKIQQTLIPPFPGYKRVPSILLFINLLIYLSYKLSKTNNNPLKIQTSIPSLSICIKSKMYQTFLKGWV